MIVSASLSPRLRELVGQEAGAMLRGSSALTPLLAAASIVVLLSIQSVFLKVNLWGRMLGLRDHRHAAHSPFLSMMPVGRDVVGKD